MTDRFRFVIVGSGNIAGTYLQAIGNVPEAMAVGMVSRSGRRPDRAAASDTLEVAESIAGIGTDFDAVILATPNGVHHEGCIAAAELGKHVLSEKVLEVSLQHVDAMIRACRTRGVKLGVTFQRRMSPDNVVVKDLLERKQLGRVFAADLSVKFYRDQAYYDSAPYRGTRDIDGGPFMQQAAHNIDIYAWFFGMPETVLSMLDTFTHDIESEDHGVALLRHGNGMIGTITASTSTRPGFPARLEIHGERGTVILENDAITTWAVEGMSNPSRAGELEVHSGAASAAVTETAGHEAIIRDFIAAVREDREPAVSGESARRTTELILRIYERGYSASSATRAR
jgi:predicted dehydrogenase